MDWASKGHLCCPKVVWLGDVHFVLGLSCSELWTEIFNVKDPELLRLANALPDTVFKARADSTTRKYIGAFRRWSAWVSTKEEVVVFPINTAHFALYLQHVGESSKSRSAVEDAVNAISWVQRLSGMAPVSSNPLIKSVMEGLQRVLAKPKVKKEPVTPQMLQKMVMSLSATPTLTEVRLCAICLLAFSAFLRHEEITKIRCCDITLSSDKMEVHILSSKTDQFRQGAVVPIARSGLSTCPVAMIERYVSLAGISLSSEKRLFRGIVKTKCGETLRPSGSLSYSRMRELVLRKIKDMGFDPREFGLHSFRAGGATAAANNPDISERHFKRHGRWRSESAKDGYVKDSEDSRLKVSKGLGI